MLRAYAEATSCVQGKTLAFHIRTDGAEIPAGRVRVENVISGESLVEELFTGHTWILKVARDWPSGLYRAALSPGQEEVYFVVRAAVPGETSPVLISLPFPTWQAYNEVGVAHQGLYQTEQPDRATKVSFDRPGGGPPPERWEEGLLRWLAESSHHVEYCSGLDLHDGDDLLAGYQLLVVNGHDEYWSLEMREAVEHFVKKGGNLAVFSGNTCWWQVRFEDDMRTMVCFRDAFSDPIALIDPLRATVEWSSAPVNYPENSLIGVSFRHGAGCWDNTEVMASEAYTVRFADHWVFAGTGLTDGDKFGFGAVGYETDAVHYEEIDGIPRATGKDGAPPSFVVLATADLSHWRDYGQGGAATMGIFRLGAGTVFNAATVNWGSSLSDPVVARITQNVVERLSRPLLPTGFETIGQAADIRALAACDNSLFGVTSDGSLVCREVCGQNLRWRAAGDAPGVIAMASPREAHGGPPVGLYSLNEDGRILYRWGTTAPATWKVVGEAPDRATAIAIADETIFVVTSDRALWHLPIRLLGKAEGWQRIDGQDSDMICLTTAGGRLFGISEANRIVTRLPLRTTAPWAELGDAARHTELAGYGGRLLATAPGKPLQWRTATPDIG
ncbi:N,N-dimethylformamidase beta subunit family domain-containing protein [Streptosporangium sp. NPDC000396]|uniref:N,N-dimethylformamidase beta subunit family domain-containing protein n=1 Tax=Streptosporangium sp. NPDC000396 TaxID=3366185 RepID=UPI0036A882BD